MNHFISLVFLTTIISDINQMPDYFNPVPGAILSVETDSADIAFHLMTEVQSIIQRHPEWSSKVLSHGIEPPKSYFFKFNGQCSDFSALNTEITRIINIVTPNKVIKCEDVGH